MSSEVIQVVSPLTPEIIYVTESGENEIIKVVEPGAQGPPGPRLRTQAYSKTGPIVVPFTSNSAWFVKDPGVLQEFTAYVSTAPVSSPLTVALTVNGVALAQVSIPIGSNYATNTTDIGDTIPANSAISIVITGTAAATGAQDLTASVTIQG